MKFAFLVNRPKFELSYLSMSRINLAACWSSRKPSSIYRLRKSIVLKSTGSVLAATFRAHEKRIRKKCQGYMILEVFEQTKKGTLTPASQLY
jgi:hypothetical protein